MKLMARTIGIRNQDFETIRQKGYFYIDKTLSAGKKY